GRRDCHLRQVLPGQRHIAAYLRFWFDLYGNHRKNVRVSTGHFLSSFAIDAVGRQFGELFVGGFFFREGLTKQIGNLGLPHALRKLNEQPIGISSPSSAIPFKAGHSTAFASSPSRLKTCSSRVTWFSVSVRWLSKAARSSSECAASDSYLEVLDNKKNVPCRRSGSVAAAPKRDGG